MARISINFFVMFTVLAVLAPSKFALATNYESSSEQQEVMHAYTPKTESSPPPPPPPPSVPQPNPTCRKLTQLCASYGVYSCCKGLSCVASIPHFGGIGSCLPFDQPPSTQTCHGLHEVCEHYGEYTCCEGSNCVSTQTIPPFAGVDTQKLKLPPGIGVCLATKP